MGNILCICVGEYVCLCMNIWFILKEIVQYQILYSHIYRQHDSLNGHFASSLNEISISLDILICWLFSLA